MHKLKARFPKGNSKLKILKFENWRYDQWKSNFSTRISGGHFGGSKGEHIRGCTIGVIFINILDKYRVK